MIVEKSPLHSLSECADVKRIEIGRNLGEIGCLQKLSSANQAPMQEKSRADIGGFPPFEISKVKESLLLP
jgi:hypothetical protein